MLQFHDRLLQFFTCRKLGSAGRWLEASYAIPCSGKHAKKYDAYYYWTLAVGIVWSLGVPLLFWYLVHRFKEQGQHDKVVANALDAIGWICTFFCLSRNLRCISNCKKAY